MCTKVFGKTKCDQHDIFLKGVVMLPVEFEYTGMKFNFEP